MCSSDLDRVGESQSAIAFNDINPQAPTHVLVIPRSHFENAAALAQGDQEALRDLFTLAAKIAEERGLKGYRTIFNTGAEAGQTVFHAHLHLLGGRALQWPPG